MPESPTNVNLGPVSWTTGATEREPHPEGREQKREPKRHGPALVGKRAESATEGENTVEATSHQLDSFA